MRQREINAAINAFGKALKDVEKLERTVNNLPHRLRHELTEVSNNVIQDWYDSYERQTNGYDPMGSLFSAYRVSVKNKKGVIDYSMSFDSKYMSKFRHHQKNEIIYNNAFLLGYHGGSAGRDFVADEPWWRGPAPFFTDWYKPAKRSFSPYDRIIDAVTQVTGNIQQEIDDGVQKVQERLAPHIRNIRGK